MILVKAISYEDFIFENISKETRQLKIKVGGHAIKGMAFKWVIWMDNSVKLLRFKFKTIWMHL